MQANAGTWSELKGRLHSRLAARAHVHCHDAHASPFAIQSALEVLIQKMKNDFGLFITVPIGPYPLGVFRSPRCGNFGLSACLFAGNTRPWILTSFRGFLIFVEIEKPAESLQNLVGSTEIQPVVFDMYPFGAKQVC